MPTGKHEHTAKATQMVQHIKNSSKQRYGRRVEEVAWKVVHSELPRPEREKK